MRNTVRIGLTQQLELQTVELSSNVSQISDRITKHILINDERKLFAHGSDGLADVAHGDEKCVFLATSARLHATTLVRTHVLSQEYL